MPKHNPKLDKPARKRKKDSYPKEKDSYENVQNYTAYYMAVVFISIVVVVAFLFIFIFNDEGIRVEKYDNVLLDYDIYTHASYQSHSDPFESHKDYWVNVCSRYDDACEGNGLILGFYNELVGQKVGTILNYQFILKCIDNDMDGIDDYTDEPALSYGNTSDTYLNTDLILWFNIKELNKSSSGEEDAAAGIMSAKSDKKQNDMLYYVIIINRKNPLLYYT